GYILKDSDYDLIYEGIKACIKGTIVINQEVANKMLVSGLKTNKKNLEDIKIRYNLNSKEINLIKEIANGLTNKEIGERLFLSEGNIKNNISNISLKLS